MSRAISLALQGGGAHGALTWGVLDRLLQEDGLEIAALSGTSAGGLNAAACKAGLLAGGRDGARTALDALWAEVGRIGDLRLNAWLREAFPVATAWGQAVQASLPFSPQGIAAQVFSPYDWGPFWRNPLADLVAGFDFSQVCAAQGPALFIGATNVRTGRIRVFSGDEITPDVLLASACLPTVFQAVEIDDPKTGTRDAYWDGGYTGNPALFPLYEKHLPDDLVIVSINPLHRDKLPVTALDIQDRVNEISFNASLLGELRAVNFVRRLIAEGRMPRGMMKELRVHLIGDEALANSLGASSKLTPQPALLAQLKAAGQAAAGRFLSEHGTKIGQQGSLDLRALFA